MNRVRVRKRVARDDQITVKQMKIDLDKALNNVAHYARELKRERHDREQEKLKLQWMVSELQEKLAENKWYTMYQEMLADYRKMDRAVERSAHHIAALREENQQLRERLMRD